MKRHWPLFAFILFACLGATFGPVVFRSWVLQHDLDGGGHTINNVAIDASSLLLDGAPVGGGGETVWTNNSALYSLLGTTNGIARFDFTDENNPTFTFGSALNSVG